MTAIGDILKILRHAKSLSSSTKSKEKSEIKEELTSIAPKDKEVKKETQTPSKERKVKPASLEESDSKSRRIVSSRLGPPTSDPVKKEDDSSSKSPSVFRRLGSQPLSEEETSPNKNIFERLGPDSENPRQSVSQERDSRDSPQEARVSSTSSDGLTLTPGKGEY